MTYARPHQGRLRYGHTRPAPGHLPTGSGRSAVELHLASDRCRDSEATGRRERTAAAAGRCPERRRPSRPDEVIAHNRAAAAATRVRRVQPSGEAIMNTTTPVIFIHGLWLHATS